MGEFFFTNCMIGLAVACALYVYFNKLRRRATIINGNRDGILVDETSVPGYTDFKIRYLVGYALAVFGDWIQGPYLYAIYESFGYSRTAIAFFYIVGYLSSLVFGTIIGTLADKYGMKNFVCLYGIIYAVSCVLQMINNCFILILTRILSGIGTSLLFSVVESWMVKVHKKRGYPENALVKTFSEATFVNGITAVIAGVIASFFADSWGFDLGYRAPFSLGTIDLLLMGAFVWIMWPSDHQEGNSSTNNSNVSVPQVSLNSINFSYVKTLLINGYNDMMSDKRIVFVCIVQSLFEGAMAIFVFVWTPTLLGACDSDEFKFASLGWIFASFMVAIMIGSQSFEYLTNTGRSVNWIARFNFGVSAIAMIISCIAASLSPSECKDYSTSTIFAYVGFAIFEICCGIYYPVISTLKSIYLPERSRAALMNFARIGLNAINILVLLFAGVFPNSVILFICFVLCAGACAVQVFKLPITTSSPQNIV